MSAKIHSSIISAIVTVLALRVRPHSIVVEIAPLISTVVESIPIVTTVVIETIFMREPIAVVGLALISLSLWPIISLFGHWYLRGIGTFLFYLVVLVFRF